MAAASIDQLIINSPFEEPSSYWSYERESRSFARKEGRRPAGYVTATPGARSFDDPGIFRELPLVNQIRPRVKAWAAGGYQGTSGITQKLLEHWNDPEQRDGRRFFFCQLEAIETLIWLAEAPAADKVGIEIPGDGGDFTRLCTKMATGSGKTIIMAMLIAWHVLNKATYPQDSRFSKYVFIVAPGLTVRNRLEVLKPDAPGNYYELFNIIPPGLHEKLRQGRVVVRNWHALMPLDPDAGPKVMKKGPESDEAFTRRALDKYADYQNWLVINDEAHHAWRVPPKASAKDFSTEDLEEATQWIGGLDRIHGTRGILTCHDLSATPFAPTGKRSTEETLFGWIVSDFGLNDAIKAGLDSIVQAEVAHDPPEQCFLGAALARGRERRCREVMTRQNAARPVDAVETADPLCGLFQIFRGKVLGARLRRHPPGVMRLVIDDEPVLIVGVLVERSPREGLIALRAFLHYLWPRVRVEGHQRMPVPDRKSTRLNSSH